MPKQEQGAIPVFTEQTPEQILASQKDGFEEAITSTASDTATEAAAAPNEDEVKAKKEADEAAAKAAADAEANKEVVPGYTSAALADALSKAQQFDSLKSSLDKVNGKFGSIEQTLKALQEAKATNTIIPMTEEDVEDLKKEYGPELAGALLKSFNKFLPKLGGAKPAEQAATPDDAAAVQAKLDAAVAAASNGVDEKLTKTTQNLELKLLNMQHKDWKSLVRSVDASGKDVGFNPDFLTWTAKLPAQDQDTLLNTWDADFLSEKLTAYKQHLTAQEAAKAASAKRGNVPGKMKAALTPSGVTGEAAVKSALDEQKEGYASA
jgi:hypothetical protein